MSETGTPDPDTPDDLCAWAKTYASTVDIAVDLDQVDWEVSKRAKRRAGACRYHPGDDTCTIVLTWQAYRAFGWRQFTDTIRHELVHAWEFQQFGESGHGARFRQKAAELDAPRHCETFSEPRYVLRCVTSDCDWRAARHRASKPVKQPADGYRCGVCQSPYVVEHVDSGATWRDHRGYQQARKELGDDW
ncbi:SprT-like domain-containing protein [Haloarchaeobius sp. TZWSO28]|uniref:SprT family zinc-dependent metalloprotease n=1 Tax=Haloarchaeobius sp. TZWSO28 TaxID=3446119 RepID=UPI003EB75A0A